jgi:hypothetical protein
VDGGGVEVRDGQPAAGIPLLQRGTAQHSTAQHRQGVMGLCVRGLSPMS